MIWNFGRNLKVEQPAQVEDDFKLDDNNVKITFRADDKIYTRAEKIIYAMGLNVPSYLIAAMAGFLAVYKELDDNAKKE